MVACTKVVEVMVEIGEWINDLIIDRLYDIWKFMCEYKDEERCQEWLLGFWHEQLGGKWYGRMKQGTLEEV